MAEARERTRVATGGAAVARRRKIPAGWGGGGGFPPPTRRTQHALSLSPLPSQRHLPTNVEARASLP